MEEKKKKEEDKSCAQAPSMLYNFGYAPREVIERFQIFCFGYKTLASAINALLERDQELKRKYRFLSPPVMYQMMAKPTENDSTIDIKKAMTALHKYMKEGRYKSVADAIEELLISPEEGDKETSLEVNHESGSHYTMVSQEEEIALEKIADAIFHKFENNVEKKQVKPKKTKFSVKIVPSKGFTKKTETLKKVKTIKQTSYDPDFDPSRANDFVWQVAVPKRKQLLGNYKEVTSPSETEVFLQDAPDVELNTPLCRFGDNYTPPSKPKHTVLTAICRLKLCADKKGSFMFEQLKLMPANVVISS